MLTLYELIALSFLILLYLNCVFEALDGISGGRIRRIEEKDELLAKRLDDCTDHDDPFRAILKLLMFIVVSVIGALSALLLYEADGNFAGKWDWVIIIASTAAAGAVSEAAARLIIIKLDITLLRTALPLLEILSKTVFRPLTAVLNAINRANDERQKNSDDEDDDSKVSVEDEILSYVENDSDDEENDLEEGEKQMIRGILDLGNMSVREIMTPRVDLDALPDTATVKEAVKAFIESGHSRIPVFGKSIDEIKGVLYAKDFLDEKAIEGKSLLSLSRKVVFIPETKEVTELLEEFKRTRMQLAVIIDEYGGTSGVVTIEDIIEEIVGEIHDEFDTDEDFQEEPKKMDDGSILLDARTQINDVNDTAGTHVPEDDETDTIGGYVCSELGRIPQKGETFEISDNLKFTVVDGDKRRIKKLKLEVTEDRENG